MLQLCFTLKAPAKPWRLSSLFAFDNSRCLFLVLISRLSNETLTIFSPQDGTTMVVLPLNWRKNIFLLLWCIFSQIFQFVLIPDDNMSNWNFPPHTSFIFSSNNLQFSYHYFMNTFAGKASKGQSQKNQQAVLEVILLLSFCCHLTVDLSWIDFSCRNFELVNTMSLLQHQLVKKVWTSWK